MEHYGCLNARKEKSPVTPTTAAGGQFFLQLVVTVGHPGPPLLCNLSTGTCAFHSHTHFHKWLNEAEGAGDQKRGCISARLMPGSCWKTHGSGAQPPTTPILSAPRLPWQQNMEMCKQCVREQFWPPRNYLLKPRRGHSSGFSRPDCGPGVHLKHSGAEDAPGSADRCGCHCLPVAKPISLMELSSWLHNTGLDEEQGVSSPLNQLCLLYFLPLESIKLTLRTKTILHVSN